MVQTPKACGSALDTASHCAVQILASTGAQPTDQPQPPLYGDGAHGGAEAR